MTEKKNFTSIEYLRAFSMLYIVGYWHIFNYTDAFPEYNNSFTNRFTLVVLGLFVFVSGFLIGHVTKKSSSFVYFYRKRLLRIYPLYVLAVVLFYVYGINDASTSIKSLIFISMYYGPAPLTLWFITMLVLFYLATPLLLQLIDNPKQYLLVSIVLFAITFALLSSFKAVDHRVLLYFPCYSLGIYCSKYGLINRIVNIWSALLLLGIWLIISYIGVDSWTLNQLKDILLILPCSYLIFTISYLNEDKFTKFKIISFLSYSSFAMYLFHRPIYSDLKAIYFPESGHFQILYLMTVCLLVVIFISWGLQKIYDIGFMAVTRQIESGS